MKQKEKTKQGMAKLIEISGENNSALISSIVLSAIGTLCQLVPFWSVYRVMAELLKHTVTGKAVHSDLLIRLAVYGLVGLLLGYFATYLGGIKAHTFAYRVICGVRLKVAEHIGKLPLGYVSNNSVGRIRQILDADVEQIEGFLAHQLPDLVGTVVMLIAMFAVMFMENIWLAFACLIPIVAGFVFQFAVMIKIMKNGGVEQNFDALEKISSSSMQYVKGMPSIKIFGQTVKSFRQFYDDIISYRDFTTEMTEIIRPGFVRFRMFVLSVATFIVPVGLLLFLRDPEDISFVMTFLFFLILAPAAAAPTLKLRGFSESMNIITEGVKRVESVLNEMPLQEVPEGKIPVKHDVTFSDVRFSYAEKGNNVLNGVSFTARQGEITALVGTSGAGKSTIAELIPRFWDVTDGSIEIGGIDIREIRQADLMEQMSFVFQESFLLSDTIYNNIALGKPDATEKQVEKAAMAAQCHDFILSLPEGYQTKIGDGGIYLSGGEMQRVSIARAILKNAPILILDEASAYADAENEHEMQLALMELIKNKTVIMIAHRLATICNADQILVIADGKIAESGTHEQLMQKNKLYAAMWKTGMESANWRMEHGKENAQ